MAGGVERVLTIKANYFADVLNYDISIILTDGKDTPLYYPLSKRIKVVNLDINFEELWSCSFLKKVIVYLKKQRKFKKRLTAELITIRPDITISLLRREINFISKIHDGSKKVGELHVNRANYRNFEANEANGLKQLFAKLWMRSLVGKLKRLDQLVVLTDKSKASWPELSNVTVISDPIPMPIPLSVSDLHAKRVITIGRYAYQKGYDMLLQAWSKVEKQYPDWTLDIFGQGDQTEYRELIADLGIDINRCHLNGPIEDVTKAYLDSSIFVLSSRFEGFGLVLVEAMACGLPVVSFDCPAGPDEILTDGTDGLLVSSGNIHDLAEKLMTLMADENLRCHLARQARQSAQRYSMASIANQWKMLFDQLMMIS